MFGRLSVAWFVLAVPPVLWLIPELAGLKPWGGQSDRFLVDQDIWVLAGLSAAMAVTPFLWRPARALAGRIAWTPSPRAVAMAFAGMVALVALAGCAAVFDGYALSRDEDMASFGAAILAHGQAWAAIAPEWRAYAGALEPEFVRISSGFWQPDYLPVNAALRALGGVIGAADLVSPLLAAVSVIATFAVGARLWPGRPSLALAAAVLLATSSQLMVTAMTPYAMTAHLALNMVWLWLHLRGGRWGHAGAIAVGLLACGLHQLAFHPLFVAPFIAQLWWERRWRTAALYTAAYAAIGLIWLNYGPVTLALAGGASHGAPAGLGGQVAAIMAARHPPAIRSMAENLIRFVTWQNPLVAPLMLLGLAGATRAGGTLRSLVGGLVLTTAAVSVLMPYQGLGWGYRYWHGLLGSAALIAALAWGRLTDRLEATDQRAAGVFFAGAAAVSVLVLTPIRAWQAWTFARPYAAAYAAIRAAPSQVVLVDHRGGWFTTDLVRNDPYLTNRPLIMGLSNLTAAQVSDLCAHYTVSVFDSADAARFGIRAVSTHVAREPSLPAACHGSYPWPAP